MTFAIDLPECRPSLLQRLDPRWKLAGLSAAALMFVFLRTLGPALAALAGALFLVALARLDGLWYLRRLGIAVSMYLLFLIWLPFVVEEGQATLELGFLTLSVPGSERLIVLTAKLTAMISLMLVLLATTPLHDAFKAARECWVPRVLVLLMLLTLRYVFLLIDEFGRLRTALRVRGFRSSANLHSYRTIGQVAGTLLVRSHERSERVAQAMRARGFDGEFRTLTEFHARWHDHAAFSLIVGYAGGLLAWDWFA